MKIGIVGSADRAVAWENHLNPHGSVTEVVIAPSLKDLGAVDGCFLLDDTDNPLETLNQAVRAGMHTFLISKLPLEQEAVEKIYHTAEESGVRIQFSHWPTLAPASQWMAQKVNKPTFIQVAREINYTDFLEMDQDLEFYWIDELAFCLKWIDGAVHHIDINKTDLSGTNAAGLHLFLRFDSGATAAIFINTGSAHNRHERFAANQNFVLTCDVISQTVRCGHAGGHLYFEKQSFDPSKAAEQAAVKFIKAIQLNKPTLYNPYDLLRLSNVMNKVRDRLVRI